MPQIQLKQGTKLSRNDNIVGPASITIVNYTLEDNTLTIHQVVTDSQLLARRQEYLWTSKEIKRECRSKESFLMKSLSESLGIELLPQNVVVDGL